MEWLLWALLCLGCAAVRSKAEAQSSPWYQDLCSYKWEAIDQDNSVGYSLKLCESSPGTSCGPGAAVCAHNHTTSTDHTIGELSQMKVVDYVVSFNTTEKCPGSSNTFQASISFHCGKTMGTPEFVASAQCVHYFEWRTYVACKKDKFKPHKEVPCYVFGSKGKHDLNPLIKVTSGYLVDDGDDNIDFYINICRSLDLPDKSCPQGSAACLITNQGAFDMGSPTAQLELLSNDRLRLQYVGVGPPPEMCNQHAPTVNITFICPSSRNSGSTPKMIAETNCRYEVEWVTEYACHRDYLESHSCKLTSQQHDISIDLSPLTRNDILYHAFSGQKDSPESYIFYMNVCGPVQTDECGREGFISNCQVKKDGLIKKVAGRYQNQTLRYSDGDLTLIYPDGTTCSTGFQRMTVINFECNKNITGQENPVYAGETDCTYYFDWETPYACVKEKEDLMCSVLDDKKHYDLSSLTRFPESDAADNWEVLDAKAADAESKRFYLNVCHKLIQTGGAAGCAEDAAVCAKDKNNKAISLGSFVSSPQKTKIGNDIRLVYTNGDVCSHKTRIQTILTLKCKPGDFESAPVLRSVSSGGCVYELEWYTAAACVLSKTQGDDCKVQDPQAGFSFDLSPLSKPNAGFYNLTGGNYDYYINVCGPVTAATCPAKAGACQSDKSGSSWSLGGANSRLSYYDGLIQLAYSNGSQYNNKRHTLRSTHVSFLCDPQAGVGKPEFQMEDNYTYNFRWYTSYACPERPHECLVTDPKTLQQYDLSSLSRSSATGNWQEMDLNDPASHKKYYINVCRPINPVQGCDRHTSVCQMKYVTEQSTPKEVVSVGNMGVSKRGPVIEGPDRLLLEFTEGSECVSDGIKLNYTTHIHLECDRGAVAKGPRFLSLQNCTARFMWQTRAACAIKTTTSTDSCSVVDPNTGFEFNLQPLASKTGYKTEGNGKDFLVNICSDVASCGEGMAGCELENGRPVSPVGVEKTLQYSTDGLLSLTYKGKLDGTTATRDTFAINFVCNRSAHSGTLKLVQEYLSSNSNHTVHDALFEFATPLACVPAPVSCRISDSEGNEYDLSHLARDTDDSPWIPIDTDGVKSRKFYINVCRTLPPVKDCPVGPLGACGVFDGASHNLGYMQSSPQVSEDGSISIVYQNGDACGEASQYSTRIILQCDDSPGSPMFDRTDGCEYVFVWRTSEACPIKKSQGSDCHVQDPKSGYEFDLSTLKGTDYSIVNNKYNYFLSICGGIEKGVCAHNPNEGAVSSCQVDGPKHKIAGLENQVLIYVDGQIILNYTGGEQCHKIYQRTTEVYFTCDPNKHPGEPQFLNETPDCTYMFTWPTALACIPVKTTSCSYNDGQGRSYDLSSLAMDHQNWEAEQPTGSSERYYINVCRSLVQQAGSWKCPSSAASCMKSGDQYVSLGQVLSAPTMERDVLKLRYTNGRSCPDGKRQSSTTINLQCDKDRVDSRPSLISVIEDCEYNFHWLTAAACPLNSTQQEGCRVTNPSTGYLFDLNSLTKAGGYTVRDSKDQSKSFQINVCGDVSSSGCEQGSAICIKDGSGSVSGGQVSKKLWYKNGLLELKYEGGDACPANSALTHSTIIQFICRPSLVSSAAPEPALIEWHADTCTHYFSFHTPLVCDHLVPCAVQNGSSLIDLTPLIHWNGYYTATDDAVEQSDASPDFYINICRPLNPIPGVSCPTGAAVCMAPDNGPPIGIGQETSGPQINSATDEVFITYSSGTVCASDPSKNYTSKIIFTCQRGLELGTPQMLRLQDCVYLFEWTTPLVCPDSTNTSGCRLTDSQLQFTFDLSALAEEVQVSSGPSTYYISACGSVKDEACKKSSVCEVTGSGSTKTATSLGISKVMTMDFKHEEQGILAQYKGGDNCPQGAAKYQSSILFICDPSLGRGSPVLLPKVDDCAATFEWRSSLVCPPMKMECKLVSNHQTFDLRSLSSLTEPWKFRYKGDSYYINLCQGIHGGLRDFPAEATVFRRLASGTTQILGRVYTQKMNYTENQKKIFVTYAAGDEVCGNGLKAKTVIELSCGFTVGHPTFTRFDRAKCEFVIGWETRSACAVKQEEVKMENGIIHVPETGVRLSLGALYFSHHQASGDIRSNGDSYIYHIQLSGINNSSLQSCFGANICQVKLNAKYRRKIGSSSKAKYYVKGGMFEVLVPSESHCGREETNTVSSTITFYCNPSAGVGIPEFMLETEGCQYLFVWHTDAICGLMAVDPQAFDGGTTEAPTLSGHSRAAALLLSLMLIGLTICLLGLVLYKKERRELVIQKVTSYCRRGNQVSYKYSKVNMDDDNGEEEMEWLMEDLEAPPTFTSHRGRAHHHGNGHITTKHMNTDGLRSFSLDEQDDDSEDEVLTVPGVRVVKSNAPAKNSSANRSALLQEESDEDLVGLLDDSDRRRKKLRPFSHGNGTTTANQKREEDDSDEDLLRM
ncbi:cation-independent mannose-6-phosphate receptor [Eucyclogobius newberryi]|uniref:cation-independent mannose-6-phosphate receptor n=1 Tax=Eucyclogobius newberryi TaxID=166745 RepID=UPI003B5A8A4A